MNILYITHRLPYPPDKGDRIRTWHVLKYLANHGRVYLATLADEPVPGESLAVLRRTATRVACIPIGGISRKFSAFTSLMVGRSISQGMFQSVELKRIVREWSREIRFDFALASASSVAPYLRVPELVNASKCVDFVDVDSRKWFDYAEASSFPKSALYSLEGRRVRKLEDEICGWADGATLVSDAETALFNEGRKVGRANVVTATNGVDLDYYRPDESAPNDNSLAFVGAFDYKPNVDGAVWFAREIWPRLRAEHPDLTLNLIGRNPVPEVVALAEVPGITVAGTVPDVRPHAKRASVVIAPLRIARGLQNKVLEAFAMGKPVVATANALGGFAPENDPPALVASSPDEWCSQLNRLLADEELRKSLGELGRQYTESHHDWNHCLDPIRQFFSVKTSRVLQPA